jgi:hypothetical protein
LPQSELLRQDQSRSAVHHEGAGQAAIQGPKRRLVAP